MLFQMNVEVDPHLEHCIPGCDIPLLQTSEFLEMRGSMI
jgi:hypothetical protein